MRLYAYCSSWQSKNVLVNSMSIDVHEWCVVLVAHLRVKCTEQLVEILR